MEQTLAIQIKLFMSGACLGQHLGHIVNNGEQSAMLHASVMPVFTLLLWYIDTSFKNNLLSLWNLTVADENTDTILKLQNQIQLIPTLRLFRLDSFFQNPIHLHVWYERQKCNAGEVYSQEGWHLKVVLVEVIYISLVSWLDIWIFLVEWSSF